MKPFGRRADTYVYNHKLILLLNCIHEADNPTVHQYLATKLSGIVNLNFTAVSLSPADCLSLGSYLPWACHADRNIPHQCEVSEIDDRCVELLMKGMMESVAKIHEHPCHLGLALYYCNLHSSGVHSIAQVLQSANCILSSLGLQDTPLEVSDLKCLVKAVARNTSLESLLFSAAITKENGPAVCKMLEKNKTLQTLTLLDCELSDHGGFYFKKGLLCNTTLQHLVICRDTSNSAISNKEAMFLAGVIKLSCPLKQFTLVIRSSIISDDNLAHISEALATNMSLHEFHFNGNITDSGGFHLAEALKHNTTLQHLDFSCPLSNMGCKYLADALTVNCSLKQLTLRAPNSIFHIAEALAINTSLQELNLSCIPELRTITKVLKHNDTLKILRLQKYHLTTADMESLATAFTVNNTLEMLVFDTYDVPNEALQSKLLANGVLQKLLEISVEKLVERFGEEQTYVVFLQELEEWEAAQLDTIY